MLLMLVAFYRWNSLLKTWKEEKRRRKKLVRSISLRKYNIQSGHHQQLLLLERMGTWGFAGETLLPSTSFSPRTILCTNLWKSYWLSCLVGRNSLKLTFLNDLLCCCARIDNILVSGETDEILPNNLYCLLQRLQDITRHFKLRTSIDHKPLISPHSENKSLCERESKDGDYF